MHLLVKQRRTATERKDAVFSLSVHLVVWRPLRGWTSEERLLKKQVVWVLAHSLPVVLPEGLPWKQGVWQAPGGSATAAGTSFLTAWWRHHCHTMHNNNNYWRKKIWSDNVNCCVAEMFISRLVKHPGIFPPTTTFKGPYCTVASSGEICNCPTRKYIDE